MFTTPETEKRDRLTAEAFANPRVGDRFHEFFSYWVFVVAIEGDRVMVMTASSPATLPDEGEIKVFESHDAYRQHFAYRSMSGYSVTLAGRDTNVVGWAPSFPEAVAAEAEKPDSRLRNAAIRAPQALPPKVAHVVAAQLLQAANHKRFGDDVMALAGEVLSLPEREAETDPDAEQIAITALTRMNASPAWRDADARAIVRDLRAAGLLRSPADQGVAPLRACGTPTHTGEGT
jgi:hypothetical protein